MLNFSKEIITLLNRIRRQVRFLYRQNPVPRVGGPFLLDAASWSAALALAAFIRYEFEWSSIGLGEILAVCVYASIAQFVAGWLFATYRGRFALGSRAELPALFLSVAASAVALMTPLFIAGNQIGLPRSLALIALPFAVVLMVGSRFVVRLLTTWSGGTPSKAFSLKPKLLPIAVLAVLALVATTIAINWSPSGRQVNVNVDAGATMPAPLGVDEIVAQQRDIWEKNPLPYENYFVDHTSVNDYLGHGRDALCIAVEGSVVLDDSGVAMNILPGQTEPYYHPVMSAQCGLSAHGLLTRGIDVDAARKSVILYADHLVSLQDEAGAFRYPFEYNYYLEDEMLPVGWVSGMAQGQAMSLLARAYDVTQDDRYLRAGKLAVDFMDVKVEDGGVTTDLSGLDPSLQDYIFFEEYVSDPPNYTLNGFMFTLLGLYDWSQVPGSSWGQDKAADYFAKGTVTLEEILPYYDLGSLTSYDLGFITFENEPPHVAARYHGVHIYLLHAMNSIVDSDLLQKYEQLWISYVAEPNAK